MIDENYFNTIFLHAPTMTRALFDEYSPTSLAELRDYIIAHIDEEITAESVIDHFGLPAKLTLESFRCQMGESMPDMILRLKKEAEAQGEKGE